MASSKAGPARKGGADLQEEKDYCPSGLQNCWVTYPLQFHQEFPEQQSLLEKSIATSETPVATCFNQQFPIWTRAA